MDPQASPPPAREQTTHRGLAVLAALNALSGWGGAVALAVGVIDFGNEINQRLPFQSVILAACALALVVAVPSSLLAWQAWFGRGDVGQTAMLVGVALVGWIVAEVAVIQSFSWLQPTYVVVGLLIWMAGNTISTR